MKFRRFLQPYDPNVHTAIDITESYRGCLLSVFVTRISRSSVSWIVYVDGARSHFDILIGTEAEALAEAVRKGCSLIDARMPHAEPALQES